MTACRRKRMIGKDMEVNQHTIWGNGLKRVIAAVASVATLAGLVGTASVALAATDTAATTAAATAPAVTGETSENIIRDEATGAFLKRIDVGTDEVTLGLKGSKALDLSGWTIKDDDDTHAFAIASGTSLAVAGEQKFAVNDEATLGNAAFGLGKADKVRVYNASGTLVLQFAWSGDDKNAVYVADSDADKMELEGSQPTPDPEPGEDAMAVDAWNGLEDVTPIDAENAYGPDDEGNLSGLVYEPGKNGKPGTLWAVDNDLNAALGKSNKGAGALSKYVYKDGKWQVDDSWVADGSNTLAKQLRFKDGSADSGVDSEGVTLINGDSSQGVFVGVERDNLNKKVARPSILRYDSAQKTSDINADGVEDLIATNEWNLLDALKGVGVEMSDANAGVEGLAFIPDATLTAGGFKTSDGKTYVPADYQHSYNGLFFAALEQTNAIYALALNADDDSVTLVQTITLPESATKAGYSGPRDLAWDGEHNQLLAQGDNDANGGSKLGTYELKDGAFQLTKLTASPDVFTGATPTADGTTEGFAITPDAETVAKDGKTVKPVFWATDATSGAANGGHSLFTGYIASTGTPASGTTTINLLNFNDFHGRIGKNLTVPFAATIEQLRAEHPDSSLLLAAGDSIGASLFNSSVQKDQPTIDVLNALGLKASAVGNHEFDKGYDDLTGRVIGADGKRNAQWDYLGANVYKKGTGTPALQEYSIQNVNGVRVGVIGVVTQETSTLVSPGGIEGIEFGDPVEAVNRVARQLTDGDESNGEADVIVAEYHEGAASNEDDATAKPTIDEQKAASPVFKKIVDDTDPAVDVIFTAHTHMKYSYTDPAHNGRPVIQTGSYAANIGQVVLDYDKATGTVTYRKSGNVAVDTSKSDDELAAAGDDTVRNVKSIVDAAVAKGQEEGGKPVGSIAADITTAFKDGTRDDRASESTMGNLVADSLLDSLSSEDRGGAEIGVVNPGGLRAEFCKTGDNEKCTIAADGTITYAQANAVLPFLNNLWTTTLTGAQFKEALEQQWQTDADGNVPSRPYLQLGLSHNVSYTYDPNAAQGNHITSVTVNGKPLDLKREYRIGSFSFLLQGGDNFRAFAAGKDTKDTGLVDRDAWIDYISKNSPLKPRYDRRAVAVTGIPADGKVTAGTSFDLQFSKLTLTSLGVPAETKLVATIDGTEVGSTAVKDGDTATLQVAVPAGLPAGAATLTVKAVTNGTTVTLPLTVAAGASTKPQPGKPEQPGQTKPGTGDERHDGANNAAGNGGNAGAVEQLSQTGAPVVAVVVAMMALLAAGGITLTRTKRNH